MAVAMLSFLFLVSILFGLGLGQAQEKQEKVGGGIGHTMEIDGKSHKFLMAKKLGGNPNRIVRWDPIDENGLRLGVEYHIPDEEPFGWVGFGFTEHGGMVGGQVMVVGRVASDDPQTNGTEFIGPFHIKGYSADGVMADPTLEFSDYTFKIKDKVALMMFTAKASHPLIRPGENATHIIGAISSSPPLAKDKLQEHDNYVLDALFFHVIPKKCPGGGNIKPSSPADGSTSAPPSDSGAPAATDTATGQPPGSNGT